MDGSATPKAHERVMHALYQRNIWADFVPRRPRQPEVQGWNGQHPAFNWTLAQAPNAVFVDVGVWKGLSSIYAGQVIRALGRDGCVISVDTFLASIEHWTTYLGHFDRHMGRPDLMDTFLDNVAYAGMMDMIVPLPTISTIAGKLLGHLGIQPGVVHVDAGHDLDEVLADARAYWPILAPGGFLIGDDYNPVWPGVMEGAAIFAAEVGQPLRIEDPKWILRKPD